MPGSRGRDFRGGDLAEGLGLELLRPFAFIAPVPRPEDVGIDAVAILFRREIHRLIAEDSFLVQVKAASVRSIKYEAEELQWLRALTLPFYWMSVDLATTTVELWSMINASNHPNYQDWKSLTLYLDATASASTIDEAHVWLEKPILRWTPAQAVEAAFQQNVYDVLKAWTAFDMKCLALRPLRMSLHATWEIGGKPQETGHAIMDKASELQSVLEKIRPYIQRLSSLCWPFAFGTPNQSVDNLLVGLLFVSDYMRQQGVEADPGGILQTLVQSRLQQHPAQTDEDQG